MIDYNNINFDQKEYILYFIENFNVNDTFINNNFKKTSSNLSDKNKIIQPYLTKLLIINHALVLI